MVYKKYIKKDGKLYGPYLYESHRINGKVTSEYHGVDNSASKKFLWMGIGLLVFVILIFSFFYLKGKITGQASLNLNANQVEGKNLEGFLEIKLKDGEFVPASSKIIFETSNQKYEYDLKDLVSESPSLGDYYVEGESIFGSGEGYGIKGTKVTYPTVYFTLISKQTQSNETSSNESTESTTIIEPETPIQENSTEPTETTQSKPTTEESVTPEGTLVETPAELPKEPISNQEAPITGGIISKIFGGISNLFLGFRGTGMVVSNLNSEEIKGQVSANNPFVYNLKDGESIEILSGSVKTDSKNMEENVLKLSMEGDKVIITTEYSESAEGFGKTYLGNEGKTLQIDLSGLNLNFEKENPKINVVYEDKNIISLEKSAEEPAKNSTTTKEKQTEPILPTIPANLTEKEISLNEESLNDDEKKILIEQFGNVSIETTKSELFNGRYIVGYRIGDYEIEYSYDSKLNDEILNQQIEIDRVKWLRDIIKRFSYKESVHEEASQFIRNYTLIGDGGAK
ncbi:MAG: hypothetical protein NTU63_03280 [Candidatus Pacearchaeota archaeon]|nr:hypothetical protein [Candidatus Pacearchaeota archaeon]